MYEYELAQARSAELRRQAADFRRAKAAQADGKERARRALPERRVIRLTRPGHIA